MNRKAAWTLAAAVLAAGLGGCANQAGDKPIMYGIEGSGAGGPPPLYGVEGNRTATVPAVNAAAGTGDHLPSDNYNRMGAAAYNGAGSSERPMPSERVGANGQPNGMVAPGAAGSTVNSVGVTVPGAAGTNTDAAIGASSTIRGNGTDTSTGNTVSGGTRAGVSGAPVRTNTNTNMDIGLPGGGGVTPYDGYNGTSVVVLPDGTTSGTNGTNSTGTNTTGTNTTGTNTGANTNGSNTGAGASGTNTWDQCRRHNHWREHHGQ